MAHAAGAHTKRQLGVRRPRLALVGKPSSVDTVRAALGELRVSLETLPSVEAACAAGDLVGIVLVSLEPNSRPVPNVAKLRSGSAAPAFVVAHDDLSGKSIRKLYETGAAGVFEWPREALLLGRFLAEMLAIRFVRGRAKKPDIALARVVRTHLKLLPGLHQIPSVSSREGFVTASGSVDTLRLKREVERTISGVSGVRGLDVGDLHVITSPVPDQKIRRTARRLLQTAPEIDSRTLAISVEAGHLILEGSAKNRRQLRRLEELVTGIAGIRNVELRVEASTGRHQANRAAARGLSDAISIIFPEEDVRVAYFSGVAVLTGTTTSLRAKRAIAAFATDHPAVERVVDKLEVRS